MVVVVVVIRNAFENNLIIGSIADVFILSPKINRKIFRNNLHVFNGKSVRNINNYFNCSFWVFCAKRCTCVIQSVDQPGRCSLFTSISHRVHFYFHRFEIHSIDLASKSIHLSHDATRQNTYIYVCICMYFDGRMCNEHISNLWCFDHCFHFFSSSYLYSKRFLYSNNAIFIANPIKMCMFSLFVLLLFSLCLSFFEL